MIALNNQTSLLNDYPAFLYDDSSSYKTLTPYLGIGDLFENEFASDCPITSCYLMPPGCVGTYIPGNVKMTPTFGLTARQDIDEGYDEKVCV